MSSNNSVMHNSDSTISISSDNQNVENRLHILALADDELSPTLVVNSLDDEEDKFEDACDVTATPSPVDLESSLDELMVAVNYFFNNKFDEARSLMLPLAKQSMYHAIGTSVFAYMEAVLTFEQEYIAKALDALNECLTVCNICRRKTTITESIGNTFKSANYSQLTDIEAHAQLCSAEATLMKALLTFIEDETLAGLMKGGIKIRSCYNTFKECVLILEQRNWNSKNSKDHFESGVRMGMGTFNLSISLLPHRIVKILEFIGFSGNKEFGLEDLLAGSKIYGLRQVICNLILLGYNLFVCQLLTQQKGDLNYCHEIIEEYLKIYSNGVFFLFFKARLEFMKGNLDIAATWYKKAWKSQSVWPQFHHFCFWELFWTNCFMLKWKEASIFTGYLIDNSRWSRTMYSYQKAVALLMLPKSEQDEDIIEKLMLDAPKYKQRIAGKSIPLEKFICKKSERFFAQNKYLVLPAFELLYLWNKFMILENYFETADSFLKIIDENLKIVNERALNKDEYAADNKALVLLLKGACLRHMNSPLQALKCLEAVLSLQKEIKVDTYLMPFAVVEIGLIYHQQGQNDAAIAALEDAKKNYTGYSLESRLHFRIHAALTKLTGPNNG